MTSRSEVGDSSDVPPAVHSAIRSPDGGELLQPGRRHLTRAPGWVNRPRRAFDPDPGPRRRPRTHQDCDRQRATDPILDELIGAAAEAEGVLAHAAVELVHARLPGHAIAAATEELRRPLEASVTDRDKLLERRRDATDVERLSGLRRVTLTSSPPTSTTSRLRSDALSSTCWPSRSP